MCHYPLWCVVVLYSYDDGDDGSVCHYPLWCVVVLYSYDDGDDGSVCVIILSGVLQCWTVMMMVMMVVCVCHYPLWCVVVLDSYDDEMMVVCVCVIILSGVL